MAVFIDGDAGSQWVRGLWCPTKTAAKHSAAEAFLANHGARLKQSAVEQLNARIPQTAPALKKVLEKTVSIVKLSPSQALKFWSAVATGALQYVPSLSWTFVTRPLDVT